MSSNNEIPDRDFESQSTGIRTRAGHAFRVVYYTLKDMASVVFPPAQVIFGM